MPQLSEVQEAQNNLEESFSRRMAQLEAQLHSGGNNKETVARVSEEFKTFRELMFAMLGLLRKQISECVKMVDVIETRHRHKSLLFLGAPEAVGEDCSATLLEVMNEKMCLQDISRSDIRHCYRIGAPSKEHRRPILVRFTTAETRHAVWKSKTALKGSGYAVREFLTKIRQRVFTDARQHFGMSSCWTQDGVVVIKAGDSGKYKVTSMDELKPLLIKYPKPSTSSSDSGDANSGTNSNKSSRRR